MNKSKLLSAQWITEDGTIMALNGQGYDTLQMDLIKGLKIITADLTQQQKKELAQSLMTQQNGDNNGSI